MNRALLYARTIPTLRPAQIIGRLWKVVHKPRIDTSPAPARRANVSLLAGPHRERSLVKRDRVRLFGREREISAAGDWNDARESKLWLYQLHYHDDLIAEGFADRAAWHDRWLGRWIHENPPGEGNGWEPYPLSIRIVRWIQWSLAGGRITPEAVHSLAVQTRYLRDSLEHHLLGNHLFANAKALVFAGLFFEGDEADGWLQRGTELVARELREQVLADGGHFERSPMYHCLFLEDLLDLSNLISGSESALPKRRRDLPDELHRTLARMRRWLRAILHPDGSIPFFNDAAFGMAADPGELEAYARRLGFGPLTALGDGLIELPESGYVRLQAGPAVVICDVGELGPRYLVGHAHADTLSFEASFFGERWFVNSGTSMYGESAERLRQRGTSAHNTVEVDGADSSEVWSGFRVARRARPLDLSVSDEARVLTLRCSHDGYERLPGRVRHLREWRLDDGSLSIVDRLTGDYTSARSALHLHPDVHVERAGERLRRGPLPVDVRLEGGRLRCEDGTWHPSFGRTVPNICLRTTLQSKTLHSRISF